MIIRNPEFKVVSVKKLVPIYQILLPTDVIGVICDHLFINIKKYQDRIRKKKDRVLYDLLREFDLSAVSKWSIPFDQVIYQLDWKLRGGKYYWLTKYNQVMFSLSREKSEEDDLSDHWSDFADDYLPWRF